VEQFPIISLPDYYTLMLRSNMQVSGQHFGDIQSFIQSKPPLLAIVKKVFHDLGPNVQIENIIKSLGWIGFRNRIANAFLDYELNGHFPDTLDSSLIVDLINIEEDVKSFEVSGFSRGFLLGFYLKMIELNGIKLKLNRFNFNLNNIPFLEFSNSRFPKVDWSYLMIIHFIEFLGEAELKNHLVKKTGFDFIYSKLKKDQKIIFAENMLSYGCSIGESDIFYATQV
jgi:hypothetical protein